jgi:hypothetical protein
MILHNVALTTANTLYIPELDRTLRIDSIDRFYVRTYEAGAMFMEIWSLAEITRCVESGYMVVR